ncbi:MAG: TrmH family RNA methyltransferase [Candidatus Pacebacteria bacterium]|nr:TrmH family RNA methyltransferase [Candidatus Paceibacterota bacterium]MCD8508424.1 TrmH family RNA methyltransferase [Candidatus Paceibacterota bacterium]MCD8528138.1 TrmH family RNA methyltransferase [Candidatus Paceibacterota bacterium]MCD8563502.1 TrmH family RNA methyltransferase [Candidatus Paceibacterota bacterium]
MTHLYLLLPDIRSAHNVGSIFRTANAAGVTKIFLTGTTPAPIDRFGRKRADIAKVALGAEDTVPWEYHASYADVLTLCRDHVDIVALEQDPRSIPYTHYTPPSARDILCVVGNEVDGISKDILEHAHTIVEIPMYGDKESLNVSVATGILLFFVRTQRAV